MIKEHQNGASAQTISGLRTVHGRCRAVIQLCCGEHLVEIVEEPSDPGLFAKQVVASLKGKEVRPVGGFISPPQTAHGDTRSEYPDLDLLAPHSPLQYSPHSSA